MCLSYNRALSLSIYALCVLSIYECAIVDSGDDGYNSISSGFSHHDEHHHEEPKPYHFGYSVKDFKKGTNFHQHETSDGHYVKGEYSVALPDGRIQTVHYKADWKNGYQADVKYAGEAYHPEVYVSGHGIHDSGSSGYDFGGGSHSSSSNYQSLGGGSHHGY